jgi:adenylate kinase
VVLVEVPEEELVRRMLKRAELEGRSDDNEGTIRRRLQVYREKTEPLIQYYEKTGALRRVEGLGTPDEVYARIRAALGI